MKIFVGRNPKTEPPDREMPDLLWEYLCESRVTEMLRAVTLARRSLTNTVNDIESRLKLYQGENIGDHNSDGQLDKGLGEI